MTPQPAITVIVLVLEPLIQLAITALGVEPAPSTLALNHLLQLAILYLLALPITITQPQPPLQDHLVLVVIVALLDIPAMLLL